MRTDDGLLIMWIYRVPEITVTTEYIYRKSTKSPQTEDLFRISLDAGQGRIITYIQLSIYGHASSVADNQ